MRQKSGLKYTIKYMKTVKLHITRYICGQPLKVNDSQVSLTNGFPTRFLYLKTLIDSNNYIKIRGVMTLLSYTRAITPTKEEEKKIKPSFNTITDMYKGKDYSIPMYFIKDWMTKNSLVKGLPKYDNTLHYISSKGSPFGKASITGPFALFYMLCNDIGMLDLFEKLIGRNSYKVIFENFSQKLYRDHRLMMPGKVIGELGKLSIVKDPELKRRVIAMLDYNSQLLLRPIHDDLLKNLTKLSQDRTYTQDPFNKWIPKGNKFWSLDLSAATDRFPISLQEKVISVMYNNRTFAEAWKEILVKRGFFYDGKTYRYSVGQPMGAYSSWGAFTLTHHLVVAWSAHLCGLDNFKDYILLGDDIVINNDKVACKYISIMTKLGVDISMSKTHVSKNTYEFAKRWIRNRIEVSPLPLKGILSNYKNPMIVLQQLMIYMNRNNTLFNGNSLELISILYNGIRIGKRTWRSYSILNHCEDFYYVLSYAFGNLNNFRCRQYLIKKGINENLVPSEELIPSFMRELLTLGLSRQAEKLGNEIKTMWDDFCKIYKDYPDFDITSLKDHPFLHGLYNRLLQIKKDLQKNVNSPKLDLIDCIVSMRVEKVDKIVALNRDTTFQTSKLDKLWKDSFKNLAHINDDNYHNYAISNFGVDQNLKVWETHFQSNLSTVKDKLDVLRYGTNPDKPQDTMCYF